VPTAGYESHSHGWTGEPRKVPGPGGPPDRMTADAGAVEEVLAALADSTRRLLREALVAHGQATAPMLAAELPVRRQPAAGREVSQWDARLAVIERPAETE
jgi:hypothetical protein